MQLVKRMLRELDDRYVADFSAKTTGLTYTDWAFPADGGHCTDLRWRVSTA